MAKVRLRRGRWVVDYRDALGRRHVSAGPGGPRGGWPHTREGRRAADAELVRLRHVIEGTAAVSAGDGGGITLAVFLAQWVEKCRHRRMAPNTIEGYASVVRTHIPPELGSLPLARVSRRHVYALLSDMMARQPRPADGTIRGVLRCISAAFGSVSGVGGIFEQNPCAGLGRELRLKGSPKGRGAAKSMKTPQLRKFVDEALRRGEDALPLVVLAWTGLRLGELYGLQESDIDFEEHELIVERQVLPAVGIVTGVPQHLRPTSEESEVKTEAGRRRVDMSDELESLFRRILTRRAERRLSGEALGDWLFLPPTRLWTPRTVQRTRERLSATMAAVLRAAGIEKRFTPHCLRHTFATGLLERSGKAHWVQRQLGHAKLELTVDLYGSGREGRDRAAANEYASRSVGPDFAQQLEDIGKRKTGTGGGGNPVAIFKNGRTKK